MPTTHSDVAVKIGGSELRGEDVFDVLVESDLDQPDHACVTLANAITHYSESVKEGEEIEIKLGLVDADEVAAVIFKGEVTGIEPVFDSRAPARVHIRALNLLHQLTRGKKSVAYLKVSDKDIVEKISQGYGLTSKFGDSPPSSPQYEHVYQHNQTDLEFLRLRATRIGYEVLVEDKTLYFRKRSDADSGILLTFGAGGSEATLERFVPRLSTSHQVSKVLVRGWDPDKKKEIIGSAIPQRSKLGDQTGAQVVNQKYSDVLAVDVDEPVSSQEEADTLAKAILYERQMNYITGDGVARGNPKLKPGLIVGINVFDQRFGGKYYITAVRHRYVHASKIGGYRTEFKFKRDARGAA
jgi:uncharacterized protein